MSLPENACCERCRFFVAGPTFEGLTGEPTEFPGECRKEAPKTCGESRWPQVKRGDWCGEFTVHPRIEERERDELALRMKRERDALGAKEVQDA